MSVINSYFIGIPIDQIRIVAPRLAVNGPNGPRGVLIKPEPTLDSCNFFGHKGRDPVA